MPTGLLTQFAETASASGGDVFSALGIDWQMLLFQAVGFTILVILMAKFVYPILIRTVDERQKTIEEGLEAARAAEDTAAKAQADIEKQLAEARKTAKDIVATAKEEATGMLAAADEKAKVQAERTIASARDEIAKEVVSAKKELEAGTIDLVARATEKVIGKTYTAKTDKAVITEALKEAK